MTEPTTAAPGSSGEDSDAEKQRARDLLPARLLNEFVYCPRLFYYEHVEGLFLESADTLRGSSEHRRVDAGKGNLPPAKRRKPGGNEDAEPATGGDPETVHSRSVSMGSERLGVVAKMDLIESWEAPAPGEDADLFSTQIVSPVDYKSGEPREGEDGPEIWDTDRMQVGLQALILRDNGYQCDTGVLYYRTTRQRVNLPVNDDLEGWIVEQIDAARQCAQGPMPPPLEDSPKCPRCSLAPICLPDETLYLTENAPAPGPPRRLLAPRDDARPLYLNTQGLYVSKKGQTIVVKEDRKAVQEVRLLDVNHLALFGSIAVSTPLIQALCQADIPVTWFSFGGWFYGITRGHALKNVFTRICQFRAAGQPDRCLEIAKLLVTGKVRNQRTLLMRNHIDPPAPALARLKDLVTRIDAVQSLEELLGQEGTAAAIYFEHFQGLIKVSDDFADPAAAPDDPERAQFFRFFFKSRNRRPPRDPINACLSLAYSLLAKDCALAALAVGFDPYVGFYHKPRHGRPALALDLMEEFRPLIADSTVLTAINNRMLNPRDFVRAGESVNLTAAGRKSFFMAYEQRMNSLITHPLFDYKVCYRRALELQARLLAKFLTGETAQYAPFTTR